MTVLGIIGGPEIIVILLLVLVLFGGKKIPELMRGLGKGVKEYKKAMNGVEEEMTNITEESSGQEQQAKA
jgi:sec-independent protein translocase protein TatA